MAGPFKLRSGNSPLYKNLGSSPSETWKRIKKVVKSFWRGDDPFPNIAIGKPLTKATEKSLKKQAKGQTVGFPKY